LVWGGFGKNKEFEKTISPQHRESGREYREKSSKYLKKKNIVLLSVRDNRSALIYPI